MFEQVTSYLPNLRRPRLECILMPPLETFPLALSITHEVFSLDIDNVRSFPIFIL